MIQMEGIRLRLPTESLKFGLRILSYSPWGRNGLARRHRSEALGYARMSEVGINGFACIFGGKTKVAWAGSGCLRGFGSGMDSWRQGLTHRHRSSDWKAMGSG